MALHRTVGGLVLEGAIGAHEHRGHHGKRTKSARHHVAHNVAVVVLAGPDEAAFGLHDARHGVVDEGVEVRDACLVKTSLVLGVKDLLEDILEAVVILLGNGVLRGEPNVLLDGKRVLEAAVGEALDGPVEVVHALHHARLLEVVHQLARLSAVFGRVDELHLARTGNAHLGIAIHIAIGVTGKRDGLGPVAHAGLDALDHDRRAEDGAVEHGADGAVGALPHLLEAVLLHARGIGRDGGALHGHTQALRGERGVHRHLVVGLIAMLEAQVVVLALEVDEGADELIFNQLPDDAGHLVAVHLNKRRGHLNLCHARSPSRCSISDGHHDTTPHVLLKAQIRRVTW